MEHEVTFTVAWGDTDPAQIVFYPNYFRWADQASHELFRAAGIPMAELQRRGEAAVLGEASARFHRALFYDDVVRVRSWVESLTEKTLTVRHRFFRGEEVVADVTELRVWVRLRDGKWRAASIPQDVRERLGAGSASPARSDPS